MDLVSGTAGPEVCALVCASPVLWICILFKYIVSSLPMTHCLLVKCRSSCIHNMWSHLRCTSDEGPFKWKNWRCCCKPLPGKINVLPRPIQLDEVMAMLNRYQSLEERQQLLLWSCGLMKGFDTSSIGDSEQLRFPFQQLIIFVQSKNENLVSGAIVLLSCCTWSTVFLRG